MSLNEFQKNKIIEHLKGLNELERKNGTNSLVETISNRYDIPQNLVEKVIAEWSAGEKPDFDQKNNPEK